MVLLKLRLVSTILVASIWYEPTSSLLLVLNEGEVTAKSNKAVPPTPSVMVTLPLLTVAFAVKSTILLREVERYFADAI